MKCLKCQNDFSRCLVINGKKHNLQRRKYCLECSPFKKHNTKKLENEYNERSCAVCNKILHRKNERGLKCWICTNRENRKNKLSKIHQITGKGCWFCGYDRCWSAMDFHHVEPHNKLFQLTTRELQYTWERVFSEMQKCVLCCCRCHREIHDGIITTEDVITLWSKKWNKF